LSWPDFGLSFWFSDFTSHLFVSLCDTEQSNFQGTQVTQYRTSINRKYRAFRGFGQAKFSNGGSVLGLSQFTQMPQLPLKMTLN
jgi:hypothetical protein